MNLRKLKKNKKKAEPKVSLVGLKSRGDICYRQGSYRDAIRYYEQALAIDAEDCELCNFLGVLHRLVGDAGQERVYYEKALAINPFHAGVNYNLGALCRQQGERREAILCLKRCVAADPANLIALNNLANLLVEEKEFDEALRFFDQLLAKKPLDFNGLLNKGLLYLEKGDLQRALRYYERAQAVEPENPKGYIYHAEAMFIEEGPANNLVRINALLERSFFDHEHQIDLFVSQALCAWITGEIPLYEQSLDFLRDRIFTTRYVANADYIERRQAYYLFLDALLPFAADVAAASATTAAAKLHIVGDSHCLSLANRLVSLAGTTYQCRSHLVMGVKAWHLAQDGANRFKLALEKAVNAIAPDSPVVFMIGEIDCRSDEGIFDHCRKTGASRSAVIRRTMEGYLDFVLGYSRLSEIRPIIAGVPAPVELKFAKLDLAARTDYLETVRDYNACLAAMTRDAGIPFLDLYHLTVNSELYSDGVFHLDNLHLQPDFLERVLQNCPL